MIHDDDATRADASDSSPAVTDELPSAPGGGERTVLAPRYVSRFGCIGAACEDNCCKGWSIGIDAKHHRAIRGALQQTKADRELFETSVKRVRKGGASRAKFALIVLNPKTGDCNFLNEDRLCKLQDRFGEALLPDVCATYPRRQSMVGDRVEIALLLSCPEAARGALLAKDAMELVDLDGKKAVPRQHWLQIAKREEAYDELLDDVRLAILEILAGASSLPEGLGTVAALAQVLGTSFARGSTIDVRQVASVFESFRDPKRWQEIGTELAGIDVPIEVSMRPLLQVIGKRFELLDGHLATLLHHAAKVYEIGEEAVIADVANRFAAQRAKTPAPVSMRLDEMMRNYAMDFAFANWFTNAPNLGVWVRGLLMRHALVRFFVFAHPEVVALDEAVDADTAVATVERATVQVVSQMTRAIEHHKPFLHLLDTVLPETMPGLEHALCLLRV